MSERFHLPPEEIPSTPKRNREVDDDDEDEDEEPRAHRPRLEDDKDDDDDDDDNNDASIDDATDTDGGRDSENDHEDGKPGKQYKCQERLVSFSPSAQSDSDDMYERFKPSYDDVRLANKVKAIAKDFAHKIKFSIEDCLMEQAAIKERQIGNRDAQIRKIRFGNEGAEREFDETMEKMETFEKQVREQEGLVATLNRVVGSQAAALKEKDEMIRSIEGELAALRERLRGAQGLPIRGRPEHK